MEALNWGPMLNAYPDSMGGTLDDIDDFLESPDGRDTFSAFYILPTIYHSDLDRGFSVIDYGINQELVSQNALTRLKKLGIDLKLDFILNHLSVNSPQFQDLLEKGDQSEYKDFFINWNRFWAGHGTMTEEGYIEPDPELIKSMFFRKPGLPILMVEFKDGTKAPYWNTFYQEVKTDADGHKSYLGQMDLNIRSEKVWDFYRQVLKTLASYGARIVRLDAFAYAPKEVGAKNFLNEPGTWDLLDKIHQEAQPLGLTLLPEIHASYQEGIYKKIGQKGYMVYDFFLPGLIIDAIENKDGSRLSVWAGEILERGLKTVNMLGCHDGIPMLDLAGLIDEDRIQKLIDLLVQRGGMIKNLHGKKNMYYQVNTTYYSALGEDDDKMLLARALQLFMPGKPQVWYLDLFAGKNDYEAVRGGGAGAHKEINRTNLTREDMRRALCRNVVLKQLQLLRFRNTFAAFAPDAAITVENPRQNLLIFTWKKGPYQACLEADLAVKRFFITGTENGQQVFYFEN